MRKLESIEKNKEIKRSWYIQGIDLDTIKELELQVPEIIQNIIDLNIYNNSLKFIRFYDLKSFNFITNQKWMIDEFDYSNMSLGELNIALNYFIKEYNKLKEKINKIKTKDELNDLKVDFIINKNHYKNLIYLIEQKKKQFEKVRK